VMTSTSTSMPARSEAQMISSSLCTDRITLAPHYYKHYKHYKHKHRTSSHVLQHK
jgi:hypothetical protein